MDIKLEKRECVEEWTGQINDKEIFYRYNINGNLVWFSQHRDSGNIYSVGVKLNDYLSEYFNVWVLCDDDKTFYPNDITIEIRHSRIKQEEVSRIVSDINYINRVCDMIMSIFKTKEHYALWYKHHKDNEHSKHKDHHCMCCGEYIEEEHLKVCDKCASEFKFEEVKDMNEIYLKIYVENNDTLVFEGQGKEDKVGYYPTRWDETAMRIGTVVVGARHITITKEAKRAFERIVSEARHSGDDISCIDIHTCYGITEDGKIDEDRGCTEVCVSYIGDIVTKVNIEEVINDENFFIGCGEGSPKLYLLDKLMLVDGN